MNKNYYFIVVLISKDSIFAFHPNKKNLLWKKDDRKWEIIESEYLIRRPWLTARRDRVKLPTGVEIPEYFIFWNILIG